MSSSNSRIVNVESAAIDSADVELGYVDDPVITNTDNPRDDTHSEDGNGTEDKQDGDKTADEQVSEKRKDRHGRSQRRFSISLSVRSLVYTAVIGILLGWLATSTWLYIHVHGQLEAQDRRANNYARAEKVALDYAVNAATMNFQDLNGWKAKLVAGTTPELNDKLTNAARSMEQILVPLQWTSTAQPLVAKVHSDTGGVYVVDCFVSVQTKTVQAPDPLQSTATYSLTIDGGKNWKITDVGGIGAVVGQK